MKKTLYNPLLDNLAALEAMSDGERRAAGRQARQDAADAGYPNKTGRCTVKLPNGDKARFTLFSA
jgi:hypothetical protein